MRLVGAGGDVTPQLLVQFTVSGAMTGVLYSLMALGVTFIFSVMRMINWAVGAFFVIGSFIEYLVLSRVLGPDLWFLGVFVSAVSVFGLGILLQQLLFRSGARGGGKQSDDYTTVVTIAILLFCRSVIGFLNGPYRHTPGSRVPNLTLGPIAVSGATLAAAAGGVLALAVFFFVLRRTWTGLALRALAQSRVGVQTAGANLGSLEMVAFGLGVALAAVAGALLAPVYLVYPTNDLVPSAKGFEVIILGGLGSIQGALLGGILLGVVESVGSALLPADYQNVYGFLLVIILLLFRPTGLLGERTRAA
jgi:branched-chain amino acid transport system permease protein